MNFWKQTTHVMSYFKEENFRGDKRLPSSFMTGFLEVSFYDLITSNSRLTAMVGKELRNGQAEVYVYMSLDFKARKINLERLSMRRPLLFRSRQSLHCLSKLFFTDRCCALH